MNLNLPGFIFVARNNRRQDRAQNPTINRVIPVKVSPESAPPPINHSGFYGVGRDPMHTWPARRIETTLSIAEINSRKAPHFLGIKTAPGSLVIMMPEGGHTPAVGRPNIMSDKQVTYGSLTELHAAQVFSPAYLKLMGG